MREKLISFFTNIQTRQDKEILLKEILNTEKSYLTDTGAVGTFTGEVTSRSPKDKYIVKDKETSKYVDFDCEYNRPIAPSVFQDIWVDVLNHLKDKKIYMLDCSLGHDDQERLDATIFTDTPSQALFCDLMFRNDKVPHFVSQFTIISSPGYRLDSKKYKINSGKFIGIDITNKRIVVVGTGYVCEIKKAIFTVFNYLKPLKNVLGMHASANCDKAGKNSALFFGLSGTGKTTLSTSENRYVVADDEIGWNDKGLFNLEDGCYAKVFELDKQHEAGIYSAIKKWAILENVPLKNGQPNYYDASITENMRCAYPLKNLDKVILDGKSDSPKNIFFLTADSTGVFPPISRLTDRQIGYYFLNGFTSKMVGAEGDTYAPSWTFSACFGAPFMPLKITRYAEILEQKVKQSKAKVWLINTGWTGGVYGVGTRIKLRDTRRMVDAVINGELDNVDFKTEPYFNLEVPVSIKGLSDDKILFPVDTWSDKSAYEKIVKKVKQAFNKNSKQNDIPEI